MFGRSKGAKGKRGEPLPDPHDGPPDGSHLSGLCPRCERLSSFQVLGSIPLTFDGGYLLGHGGSRTPTYYEQMTVLICRHCEQGVSVVEEQLHDGKSRDEGGRTGVITWRGIHWWPLPGAAAHPAVPTAIASAFEEAVVAHSANCPRACAVMARRTLEAIADDKGQTTGTLAKRLEALSQAGLLHPALVGWAREVRLVGNTGAHFDPIDDVSKEDAAQLVRFTSELLRFLYILPSELDGRRNAAP